MSDFVERMKQELVELQVRREKLTKFIGSDEFDKLDVDNRRLLSKQNDLMRRYADTLARRISLNEK